MSSLYDDRSLLIFVLVAMALAMDACKFNRRSQDFACESTAQCEFGRMCLDGWCVPAEGSDGSPIDSAAPLDGPDAPPVPDATGDAFVCPSGCDRCDLETCVLACDLQDSCPALLTCPAGADCRIECNGRNSCGGGIDCTLAHSCRIQCVNNDTCDAPIVCGPGACRVECTGSASCVAGIDCSTACQCDTFCAGANSCSPTAPICPGTTQCMNGIDCTSGPGPCRTCP